MHFLNLGIGSITYIPLWLKAVLLQMLGEQFVLSTASPRTSQQSTGFTVFGVYHQRKIKVPAFLYESL